MAEANKAQCESGPCPFSLTGSHIEARRITQPSGLTSARLGAGVLKLGVGGVPHPQSQGTLTPTPLLHPTACRSVPAGAGMMVGLFCQPAAPYTRLPCGKEPAALDHTFPWQLGCWHVNGAKPTRLFGRMGA